MAYPVLAPNSTWYKSSANRPTITQINIVDSYTPTGSENESWNADVGNTGAIKCYKTGTVLTIAGNGSGKIAMNMDSSYIFNGFTGMTSFTGSNVLDASNVATLEKAFYDCMALKTLDVNTWDTSNVENLLAAFNGMLALESINVRNWNTGKVTSMKAVFQCDVKLTELDLTDWTTDNVTTLNSMFGGVDSYGGPMGLTTIIGIEKWNTNKVTDMASVFQLCNSLEEIDVSNWDTSSCTTMEWMFACIGDGGHLQNLDVSKWNVSKVTSMKSMFNLQKYLASLDVSNWDISSCTNLGYMFENCTSLKTLDVSNWDTSNVTNMVRMFNKCISLTSLNVSNWDVSKVTTFRAMFQSGSYGNPSIIINELDVSKWDTSSATDMSFMFYGCQGCKTLDVSNWDVSKVTTFDHMFAHSYLIVNGIENWATSTAAVNLNCMFHSLKNKTIDVSKFNTSNVQFFCQMFQNSAVSEIIGLENFSTSNGLGFDEMFLNCTNLKELNLSSFDTTKAKDGVLGSANGNHYTMTLMDMLTNMPSLEKITFGEKFSFNGDGTTTANVLEIPIPSAENITGADGNWYTRLRESYAPTDIPSKTTQTYYASLNLVNDIDYLIKNGTLLDLADSVRSKANTYDYVSPIQMMNTIDNLKIDNYMNAEGVRF